MHNLSSLSEEYVGRIAVAVWIGRLTDDAARDALVAYAAASQPLEHASTERILEAMLAIYRHRRDGQELCS